MTSEIVAKGFWSYARSDDEREGGRITRLAERVRSEFEMLTGATIEIFVDREGIKWGQDFRSRLDEELQSTAFFIPILTPTYFLRVECRREMQAFVSAATALGLEELILSIRYTALPDLREDSADELKAIAARMQYEAWDSLRFVEEDSAPYRSGVHKLAARLVELTERLEKRPTDSAQDPARAASSELLTGSQPVERPEDDEAPGLIDLLADFQPATSEWQKTIEALPKALNDFSAVFDGANAEMGRADAKPNPFAARLSVARRLAADIEEPLSEIEVLSKRYASGLIRLDPIVRAIVTAETGEDAERMRTSVSQLVDAARKAMTGISGAAEAARRYQNVSRDLRPVMRRFEAALRNVLDGQEIIDSWLPALPAGK